ncbi:uncharacterized protein LOC132285643 [Cornus florida]|uniref:uncharacterized protein LOC132285643 n=1 Tax=Cornus florida TaxID=4283 RepID=UPI00289CE59D|nr:uncharacterized protein LOC132285643 [Cornus florida]
MIQLLFTLVFSEMFLILTLLFRTPLRNVLIRGLDKVKQGRVPIMAQTVAGTLIVVLASSLYSIIKIQRRNIDGATTNPTDQVLLANQLLEASLMGFTLFLAGMIDRLHYYIKQLQELRKSLEDMKNREMDAFEKEIPAVKTRNKQPESESKREMKEANPKAVKEINNT